MPCCVDPHTHNHRRHPISNADQLADHDSEHPDHVHDDVCNRDFDKQPVTFAELLDAWIDDSDFAHWKLLHQHAPFELSNGTQNVAALIGLHHDLAYDLARLSPSERAEFDRRTT